MFHHARTPQAGRSLLSFLGLIADSEDHQISGAPEFGLALRTQLLVGGDTYAIQKQPEYEAAFGRHEEEEGDGEVKVALRQGAKQAASAASAEAVPPLDNARRVLPSSSSRGRGSMDGAAPGIITHGSVRPSPRAPAVRPSSGFSQQEGGGAGEVASQQEADGEQARGNSAAGGRRGEVAGGGQEMEQRQEQQVLTGAQRFRKARANQVMPLPQEYLQQAQGGSGRRRKGSGGGSSSSSDEG